MGESGGSGCPGLQSPSVLRPGSQAAAAAAQGTASIVPAKELELVRETGGGRVTSAGGRIVRASDKKIQARESATGRAKGGSVGMQEVAAVGAAGTWILVGRGRADLRWDGG